MRDHLFLGMAAFVAGVSLGKSFTKLSSSSSSISSVPLSQLGNETIQDVIYNTYSFIWFPPPICGTQNYVSKILAIN